MMSLYKGKFSIAVYSANEQLLAVLNNVKELSDYLSVSKKRATNLLTHRFSKKRFLDKESKIHINKVAYKVCLIKEEKIMPEIHYLKIKPEYYNLKMRNLKPWEIRNNDRNFQVGDLIHYISVDGTPIPTDENNLYKIVYVYFDAELKIENKVIFTDKPIVPTVEQYHSFKMFHQKSL